MTLSLAENVREVLDLVMVFFVGPSLLGRYPSG